MGTAKKGRGWCEGFLDNRSQRNSKANSTPEELTDDLMERSASEPVPGNEEDAEEARPENK